MNPAQQRVIDRPGQLARQQRTVETAVVETQPVHLLAGVPGAGAKQKDIARDRPRFTQQGPLPTGPAHNHLDLDESVIVRRIVRMRGDIVRLDPVL